MRGLLETITYARPIHVTAMWRISLAAQRRPIIVRRQREMSSGIGQASMAVRNVWKRSPSWAVVAGVLLAGCLVFHFRPSAFPRGMDANGDRVVSPEEWIAFHARRPRFYGGYDDGGPIPKGSATYYEREFRRVDCDHDSKMDAYEYRELRLNMRWCGSRPHGFDWWERLLVDSGVLDIPRPLR
jgi:hypothetical protein